MDDDSGFTGKVVRVMRMPTGVTSAYDGRGCTEGERHDHAGADCGSGKDFSEHLDLSPLPFARRANTLARFRFQDETTILARSEVGRRRTE
jgi:hypothetical protein